MKDLYGRQIDNTAEKLNEERNRFTEQASILDKNLESKYDSYKMNMTEKMNEIMFQVNKCKI